MTVRAVAAADSEDPWTHIAYRIAAAAAVSGPRWPVGRIVAKITFFLPSLCNVLLSLSFSFSFSRSASSSPCHLLNVCETFSRGNPRCSTASRCLHDHDPTFHSFSNCVLHSYDLSAFWQLQIRIRWRPWVFVPLERRRRRKKEKIRRIVLLSRTSSFLFSSLLFSSFLFYVLLASVRSLANLETRRWIIDRYGNTTLDTRSRHCEIQPNGPWAPFWIETFAVVGR